MAESGGSWPNENDGSDVFPDPIPPGPPISDPPRDGRVTEKALWQVLDLSRQLATTSDEDELFSKLLDGAIDLLGAERGVVLSWDPESGFTARFARDHGGQTLDAETLKVSLSLSTQAIERNRLVSWDGADEDDGPVSASRKNLMLAQAIAAPLQNGGSVCGVLYLDTVARRMRVRGKERETLVEALAGHVSAALWKSSRIEALKTERESLEMLNQDLRISLGRGTGVPNLIGESAEVRRVADRMRQFANIEIPILIRGEPGVGKDVVARALHAMSNRREGPLVTINCPELLGDTGRSELYGHVKGAFTGAIADRIGKIESANGGTVFFDEVGDLGPELQAMLLVPLERRVVVPLGSNHERAVNVRIIAATNQNLEEMVAQRRFREDLLARLNGVTLELRPLRERPEDVLPLARHWLEHYERETPRGVRGFTPEAMAAIQSYDWRDNVRGIRNAIQVGHGICPENGLIGVEDLRPRMPDLAPRSSAPGLGTFDALGSQTLADFTALAERNAIVEGLRQNGWNITHAANSLGISRQHLHNRMRVHDIVRPGSHKVASSQRNVVST
ncbi:MAG: sigma 54-interacting transcriptional regulator [Candidatus Eisenbacteria bacterium]|nr:sigma 54-interacting transcriptional regulator [Candidatus Eisenbacteria bacterium]